MMGAAHASLVGGAGGATTDAKLTAGPGGVGGFTSAVADEKAAFNVASGLAGVPEDNLTALTRTKRLPKEETV